MGNNVEADARGNEGKMGYLIDPIFFSGTYESGTAFGERHNPKVVLWLKYPPEKSRGSRLDCGSPTGAGMVGIPIRQCDKSVA